MRAITVLAVWLFLPLTTYAESVAVLPVTYKIYRTNSDSPERAEKVKAAVILGVEKAGLTPMTGEDIDQEAETLASTNERYCTSSECPLLVANKVGADLGLVVRVSDQDGQFDIQIYTTYAEPISKSPFGTLNSVLKRITAMVADSLKEGLNNMPDAAEAASDLEPASEPPAVPADRAEDEAIAGEDQQAGAALDGSSEPPPPAPDLDAQRKRLKPPVFWSLLGVSLALGVGYGASETVGYLTWKDEKTWDGNREKAFEAWQLANRITLGVTAAGVIATTVVAFFTDFGKSPGDDDDEEDAFQRLEGRVATASDRRARRDAFGRVRLIPAVGAEFGGLALQGAF